jgi:hypothetical protein
MQRLRQMIGFGYLGVFLITLLATTFWQPLGYAPFPLRLGPAGEPITVTIWYGTEKEAWLEDAAQRFAATNPTINGRPITIALKGLGSRELALRTAQQQWNGETPPTVLSPASSLWVEALRDEWPKRGNSGEIVLDGANAPQPLVLTPLVFVVWEERAQALWSNGPNTFWKDIHDALADPQGWTGHVNPNAPDALKAQAANWGFVKFGHTSPLTSNSGAQAVVLLAYGFHNKNSGLTVNDILDPAFQSWFLDIQRSVLEFGNSTGTFMTNMVRFGPSKYDLAVVYENLAIENIEAAQGRWGDTLRVVYPPATTFSDHPYAILNGPWTTPDQQQAAARFRDFLLTRPIQELSLQYGFRPADPSVPIISNDANNPFNKYRQFGVTVDIPQQIETPSGDVLNTLLELWRREINK